MQASGTRVKIRTNDRAWAARNNLDFQDEGMGDGYGFATLTVPTVEQVTFAGRDMVRFNLGADLPRDYPNPWVLTPATNVVAN